MYPEQIRIIKQFIPKFDCIQNHIILFLKGNRLYENGVENKKCYAKTHDMKIGETVYIFNGEAFGLNSAYCSDLRCFLDNLDESSVKKYYNSIMKKKESKSQSKKITSKESSSKKN